MFFSFQERKKRELECYRQEKKRLQKMEKDEMELEYINLKSEYERKKNILFVFMTAIVVSILLYTWSAFFELARKIMQYAASASDGGIEIAKVTFYLCVILIIFVTVVAVGILVIHIRRIGQLYKKILMIEEVKKERDNVLVHRR